MARRQQTTAHERALRVLGYSRTSTSGQVVSGAGLADQEGAIRSECDRRGWDLLQIVTDAGLSGKSLRKRAELEAAMGALDGGEADVLVAAKLDRLSRSVVDFAYIMGRAHKGGWQVVVLDVAVDTKTPAGELLAGVMAQFAQYERRIIGERTKAALAVKRAAGVRLGRPSQQDPAVVARILADRQAGLTLKVIAEQLNADQVPASAGGHWHPTSVRRALLWRSQPEPTERSITQ